jgi:predicted DsbA family dithiol-disulfide isomerase
LAASLAGSMALVSEKIKAITIEANEFPDLSAQFNVRGVPRTIINKRFAIDGAMPEQAFVESVLEAAQKS